MTCFWGQVKMAMIIHFTKADKMQEISNSENQDPLVQREPFHKLKDKPKRSKYNINGP